MGWGVVMMVEEFRHRWRVSRRDEERRADLRQRAPYDRAAAKDLRRRLLLDLRRQQAVRKDPQTDRGTRQERAGLLQDLERAEQATRDELAQVEMWLDRG